MADVLIAEATASFRLRLSRLLAGPSLRVMAPVVDPLELRTVICEATPDVLVLDDSFFEPIPAAPCEWPGVDLEQLSCEFPHMLIVVLSSLGIDQGLLGRGLNGRAVVMINKEDVLTELPRAIERFLIGLPSRERNG